MIRLTIFFFLGAIIADYYNLLPLEFAQDLHRIIGELKGFLDMGIKAVEDYAIQLAFTFIGLCLVYFLAHF